MMNWAYTFGYLRGRKITRIISAPTGITSEDLMKIHADTCRAFPDGRTRTYGDKI